MAHAETEPLTFKPAEAAAIKPFSAPYSDNDDRLVQTFLADTKLSPAAEQSAQSRAALYVEEIRAKHSQIGGLEDFLREYGLSTKEGLALMALAEALLRVPDAATQDKLIEDKIGVGNWAEQEGGDTWFVTAATWGLGLSSRIIRPGETPRSVLESVVKRIGMPSVRTGVKQAMRFLGHHFVLGETIEEALGRASSKEKIGFRYSFDMLGEGARTRADAKRYHAAYSDAIEKIGAAAGTAGTLPARPGISVKLSALHPRYLPTKRDQVFEEIVPSLLELAQAAKAHNLNFTVDAEEADRLEISLEIIEAVFRDPSLRGWGGFGLAIQAYQKRAVAVVDWVSALARSKNDRMMVRLVKGAYWDTEIKRAQERGLDDFPVFTRKAATDLCYLAAAKRMLDARDVLYPQFATHNALTVSTIMEMAGDREGFEFQRLHGMGEALFDHVLQEDHIACRIYAPVGGHRDLLAYLVRRLLENGANSSFVSAVGDTKIPVEQLLKDPADYLSDGTARHPNIRLPRALYGNSRKNSKGLEFGDKSALDTLIKGVKVAAETTVTAEPLIAQKRAQEGQKPLKRPADCSVAAGFVVETDPGDVRLAVNQAVIGFKEWSHAPVDQRANALRKAADLLEANRDHLMALLAHEAGKTLDDGIAEIREAVDFCRYYANEAERLMAHPEIMPGPTGEENLYALHGRGPFVCISPWNFPLAIFLGQVTAALAAGNSVLAKPAEQTPLIAHEAVRFLHQAGVSDNVVQLLPGPGNTIGAALLDDPRIAGVAFTGSTATARAINRQLAAKDGPIVPLIAETGGMNAMIVDATALPEQVCDDVVMSAFRSAGQRCSALRILFLQEEVADSMLNMIKGAADELVLGDPSQPETDIGPVIDETARRRLATHIEDMEHAEKIAYRGSEPKGGTFFAPHIVELKDPAVLKEEVFGPVLHVVRYKVADLHRVIDAINASGYGLTFGVHSRVERTISEICGKIKAGNLYVNRNTIGAIVGTQPFGGTGLSGTGNKAGGPNYLIRFCEEQVISTNTAAAGGNASLLALED
ncbi:MAG: bifunctional proline dehydrogenase/L-glutamate gamma-semialdehyde dehydrogenase PutA [Pseudomonadota bacterium]